MRHPLLNVLIAICAGLFLNALPLAAAPAAPAKSYVCPDCGCPNDGKIFDKPGLCPSCGMALIEKKGNESAPKRTRVAVLLFDGAEIIDYAGPWEAFGEAGFDVFSVAENKKPITAVFGQKISADYTFADSPPADVVLIPGGAIRTAVEDNALLEWVKKNATASAHVMSVCSGAFILARAGLLDGLTATTVSGRLDQLAQAAPKTHVVHDRRFVDNGKIITTAGLSSGIDGAFHLISKIRGKGMAQATALGMEYRWDPDSNYARAALADRYLPDLEGTHAEVLSIGGDTNHWEVEATVPKVDSAGTILDLLGERITHNTPHARGPVALQRQSLPDGGGTLHWNFTGEDGRAWTGQVRVEPSHAGAEKLNFSLQLNGEIKST